MKHLLCLILIAVINCALEARAGTTLGNVVAVERQITNIYNSCVRNLQGQTQGKHFFFMCGIRYLNPAYELPVNNGGVLRFKDVDCSVDGELGNGSLILTFGNSRVPVEFETAKNCLRRVLINKDTIKAIVYTIK